MPNLKAYAEAHKRGLLKGPKLSAYEELTRRGLAGVPTLPPTGTPLDATPRPAPDILTGNKEFAKKMLPKWYTREKGDEGIYAEPPLDLSVLYEDAVLPGTIKAYHGGPAAFRKFSDKFMKTGEGAHAFGWGTYASESKGVAKSYAKPRTEMAYQGIRYSAMPKDEFRSMVSLIADKIRRGQSPFVAKTQARAEIERSLRAIDEKKPISSAVKGKLLERLDAVKRVDENLISSIDTGSNLYKVKLNPGRTDEVWLDWDKKVPDEMSDRIARSLVDEKIKKSPVLQDKYKNLEGFDKNIERQVSLYKQEFDTVGRVVYENLARQLGSQEAASKFLNRAGIDGIRYPVGTLSGGATQKVPKKFKKEWDALQKRDVDLSQKQLELSLDDFFEGDTTNKKLAKIAAERKKIQTRMDEIIVVPKNYVIFDPKNIDIMEGPGKNVKFNVGFGQKVKPGKFRQLAKGQKPVKYHGRVKGAPFKKGEPIFLTHSKKDAEFYATKSSAQGEILEFNSKIENPASYDDLIQAVKESKATKKDIEKYSPYEGENINDYLYVPGVVKNLKKRGFDGFKGYDVLGNDEIPVTVAFDKSQLSQRVKPAKFRQLAKGAKPVKDIKPLGDKFITRKGDIDVAPAIQKNIWEKMPGSTGRMRVIPGKHLGAQSQKYLRKIKNRTGERGDYRRPEKQPKTGLSLDFCTDCAKRHGTHGACPYCYVEHGRVWNKVLEKQGKRMPSAGARVGEYPYNHDIMYMPTQLVNDTNRNGGLRMFSLGDYRPDIDYDNVGRALSDAKARNLIIKAVTKEEEFIKQFGNHPNLRANISTDLLPRNMSNAPTIEEAMQWAAGRPNINIRGVALNHEQAHRLGGDNRTAVITLYHGMSDPEKLIKLIRVQNPKLIEAVGEKALKKEVSTWHNFSQREVLEFAEKYPGRVCCQGGKCAKDPTKCGFGLVGAGFILPGVMIPEEEEKKSD